MKSKVQFLLEEAERIQRELRAELEKNHPAEQIFLGGKLDPTPKKKCTCVTSMNCGVHSRRCKCELTTATGDGRVWIGHDPDCEDRRG